MNVLRNLRPRMVDLFWLAGLAFATFLVYGSSLAYPFFWVDPIDIGLAGSRSLSTIFTSSQGYLYYRPLAFTLWKTLHLLSGRFDPFVFHLVQVLTHVLNAWLFYALARRIFRRRWLAGIAALLFAWYPASYQTVTWVIAPQAQATAFLLGSAIAYYDGRTSNDRRRIWLSLALLALALPFHENAISFGFAVAALEVYLVLIRADSVLVYAGVEPLGGFRLKPPFRVGINAIGNRFKQTNAQNGKLAERISRWPIGHIGLCAAFAAIWFLVPKDPNSAVARFDPAAGWYLLQGLIWPVAGAAGWWRAWLGGPAWQPLILAAPLTLLFLIVVYRYAHRLALLVLGLVWFAVMVLPIWTTRGIAYVGVSPRIFYVAAPGAILIWVGLLAFDLKSTPANRLWKFGTFALTGLILVQAASFLIVRKDLQDDAMLAIWDIVRSGEHAGGRADLLYVNVPDQITPRYREYPVGFFRAILMPVSVDLGQYVELHTSVRPATRSLSVPALAGLDDYPHQVDMRGEAVSQIELSAAIRAADAVFFTEYSPTGAVRVVEAGNVNAQATDSYLATFGDRARLVDVQIREDSDEMLIALTWQCLGRFEPNETIFVHGLDERGQLALQADGDPLRGLFPLTECRPGEHIRDVRFLPSSAREKVTVNTGLYNRLTGERLPAFDAAGSPVPDNAVTIAPSR